MLTLGACSGGDDDATGADGAEGEAAAGVERPDGPAAAISGPLTRGDGINLAAAAPGPDLEDAGWVEEEYAAEGTATSYRSTRALPADGSFELEEDATADYRTRIVVRRPGDAADFNGTVVVEWLNVSAGLDANPDYAYTADELVRGGYAWVGVSAQRIGIEGGPVAVSVGPAEGLSGQGLRALDPERYDSLHHPGDAFAYDIYTQVARALRDPGATDPLGGLEPERVLAVGESQSAFTLTTYANGVQPLTLAYDGFLIHSRGGAAAPLGEPDAGIDIAGTVGGESTRIRTDLDAPVLVLETETDVLSVLNYHPARQPDSERFRLWEVAGTAHADAYLIGDLAGAVGCPTPINAGPHHFVVKAALRSLDTWVRTGEAPPEAERIETDSTPAYVRDGNGNVRGGVRTPQVDVPVSTLSGEAAEGSSLICLLLGSTTPLDGDRLRELYPSREAYLDAYTEAADAAIEAGFVLEDDREALLADADPAAIPG
ncbi:MAG TPA: alpha/beta hydrolase domain-containing protein [Acidimicrobiales bacterium]